MQYRSIRAALAYYGKTMSDLQEYLGISRTTLSDKMTAKVGWWLDEAVLVTQFFNEMGAGYTIDELFEINLPAETHSGEAF